MKHWICCVLLHGWILHAYCQDPTFTQFHNVRAYLNPALVGIQHGVSANVAYRNQWMQIPGAFQTVYAAVEVQEPYLKSGLGFSMLQDVAGQAAMVTQQFAFLYNYFVSPNLHIGLMPNVTRKYFDDKTYIFSGQLDPVFGNVGTLPPPVLEQIYTFDVGTGASYRGDFTGNLKGRYMIGVAANHLWPWRNESLQNLVSKPPMRISVHGGVELPIVNFFDGDVKPRKLTCLPSFKYEWQQNMYQFAIGCQLIYQSTAYAGFYHQNSGRFNGLNTNAFCFLAGFKTPLSKSQTLDIGINYDVNGTGISLQSGGVLEMTANMNFSAAHLFSGRGARGSGKNILKCESFF